jgi:DNA-binding CsgD family transcriptional regulator
MHPLRSHAVDEAGLTTITRVAAAAASGGSVRERAQEAVDELQALIPMENALLSHLALGSGARSAIVNNGYSERLVSCLNGGEYHAEFVEPFGLPNKGWPVREHELPVDPLTLHCVTEYFRPAGLQGGLMCALVTADGRYVGFLDMSGSDPRGPSDEACAVVGHVAPVLAAMIDPLQSPRRLASTLDEDARALALLPDGRLMPLQGEPVEELVSREQELRAVVGRELAGGRPSAAFLWPTAARGWYRCEAYRCRDETTVVTVRSPGPLLDLTPRELEVLTYLAQGRSNAEIAVEMAVVVRTVKAHVEHIFDKLGVRTRTAAVARAIEEGLRLPGRT